MKFFRKGKLSLSQESLRYDGDLKTLKGKRGLTKKVVESPEYHRPHIKKGILRFRTLCLLLKFLTSVPTFASFTSFVREHLEVNIKKARVSFYQKGRGIRNQDPHIMIMFQFSVLPPLVLPLLRLFLPNHCLLCDKSFCKQS